MRYSFAFATGNTTVYTCQLYIQVRIRNKCPYLLTGTHGDKSGVSSKIRNHAINGQSGCCGCCILLCNTHFNKLIREFLGKTCCTHSQHTVGTDHHYSVVFFSKCFQALHKPNTGTFYFIQDLILLILTWLFDVLRQ